MHRVDDIFALNGLLQEGNSATGQEPHRVRAAWFNDLRENVARFIEFAGPALIEGDYNQLIDAMKAFVADRASVASVAALRVAPVETGSFMWVSGYHQADGVAAKPYWWDADATAVDDGGSVIAKTGYAGNGRWRAAFLLPYLTPQDWGARGQDGAEDAAAFGAICARLTALGGGHVKIPALGYDYRLGKRGAPKAGTAIEPPSNTIWEFEPGAKIIHNAVTKVVPETGSSFPTAIRLRDVSNVQIIRPDIDGQCTGPAGAGGPIRRAITWEGAGSNIEIVDAFVENCNDYHFGVLDALNADRKCAFDNLQVRGLRSRGQVSPKSIVVEIFPKKSILIDGERRPACANLKLTGIDIDGTNGSLDSTRHAYTGVKISNVNGVFLDEIHVAGGKVAAVSLLNGVRDVKATRIETSRAAVGLNILTQRSVCALRTQNIQVDEFSYDRGGMTGATPYAMIIGGKVPSLNIGKVNNRGGHVALAASSNELLHVGGDALHLDTINATRPGTVTGQTSGAVANVMGFDDGIVAVDRRATVAWSPGETLVSSNGIELTLNSVEDDDELTGALIGPTKMRGAGNISFQTTKRAVALPTPKGLTWGPIVMENDSPGKNLCVFRGNPAQWAPERCTFGPFFLRGAGETAIVIGGVGNRLRPVFDHAGYDSAVSTIVQDEGTDTVIEHIQLVSGPRRYALRKSAGSGLKIGGFSGPTPIGSPILFTGLEGADVSMPVGSALVASPVLDLAGAAVDEAVFVASARTVLLGIQVAYLEATGTGAQAGLRVGRRSAAGGRLDNGYFLAFVTGARQTVGSTVKYINTGGVRAFANRLLAPGDALTIGTGGGGAGKAIVKVSLVAYVE